MCSLLEQSQFQAFRYLSICDVSLGSSSEPPNTSSIAQATPQATNTIIEAINAMPELSPIGLATVKTSTAMPGIALMNTGAARLTDGTIRIGPNK